MIKKMITCTACIVLLSACSVNTSQQPIATTYPITDQQKMQAAHHWDVLAEHEAKLISESMSEYPSGLFIAGEEGFSTFNQSFKNLLTSHLVKGGSIVKTSPSNAAIVTYDVNVIHHKDQDINRAPVGAWTMLAGGAVAVAHAAHRWSPPIKILIPGAVVADAFSGNWVARTNFEIIVTTKITTKDQITYSSSNIYYINGGDYDQYYAQVATKNIKVVGE